MSQIIVGVGQIGISRNPEDSIKTFALGSCVALMFWSPFIKAAGLAHIALPDSQDGQKTKKDMPAYFADLAIPLMLEHFRQFGISGTGQILVKLAGGANIMDPHGKFNIGKRNVLAIKKNLWKFRLGALAEDVGKDFSRTVSIAISSGLVSISSPRRGQWIL